MSGQPLPGPAQLLQDARRLPGVFLPLALLLGACGSSSTSTPAPTVSSARLATVPPGSGPSVQAISLTVKDLPAGFSQTQAQPGSNPELQYSSYFVTFSKATPSPPTAVRSKVASYKNLKAAQQNYLHILQQNQLSTTAYQRFPLTGLGNEATGGTHQSTNNGAAITTIAVVFRRGTYTGIVSMIGSKGTFSRQEVINLAHKIDQNIQSGK